MLLEEWSADWRNSPRMLFAVNTSENLRKAASIGGRKMATAYLTAMLGFDSRVQFAAWVARNG